MNDGLSAIKQFMNIGPILVTNQNAVDCSMLIPRRGAIESAGVLIVIEVEVNAPNGECRGHSTGGECFSCYSSPFHCS